MKSNNVLLLGSPHTGKIRIAQHISKDLDTSTVLLNSHSGLIYNFDLKTKYFSLNANLLIEEYPDSRDSQMSPVSLLHLFLKEFKSPEFTELREALDGLIFTVDVSAGEETIALLLDLFAQIKDLMEHNDVFLVVVTFGLPEQKLNVESIEDEVIAHGFEFVNFLDEGKNEYMEKIGKDRLVEILETHDWSQTDKPIDEKTYTRHKKEKIASMTELLLLDDNTQSTDESLAKVDLDVLLSKLKSDKLRSEGMTEEQKKSFVDDLVDNYMEFF